MTIALLGCVIALSACVATPPILEVPEAVTADRLDYLDDQQWDRLLAGEVVVTENESVGEVQLHRAVMLVPVGVEDFWEWLGDARLYGRWVPDLMLHCLVEGEPTGRSSAWRQVYDLGPTDVEFVADYEVVSEERKVRWGLKEGYEHDVVDLAGYFSTNPTHRPDFAIYTFSVYLETGWWFAPRAIEQWIAARRLPHLMAGVREYVQTNREAIINHDRTIHAPDPAELHCAELESR